MRYKLLGRTGLRVSELCLGAMTFGEDWGSLLRGAPKEESRKIFDAFMDAGGNFIDTANVYQHGTSEKYLGDFIESHGRRGNFILATKYTLSTNPDDPNAGGNHRKNLVQSIRASLGRLQLDYIDILWVHVWDPMTPVEEMMRTLDDLIRSGKVLYAGISDAPAWVVSHANTIAELKGWSPFTGLQVPYSLIERSAERELFPMAKALDIGVTAWSPLAGGVLTGKYSQNIEEVEKQRKKRKTKLKGNDDDELRRYSSDNPMSAMFLNERNISIADEVAKIASELERTPSQVALNWVRQRGQQQQQQEQRQPVIIPIIGARTYSQVKDNLGCLDFKLKSEYMQRLNYISKIPLGFPYEFMNSDLVRGFIYGKTFPLIDNHRD
jgi:aryl-alcohol dehydrogenase-like predicted oxidoreductase